MRRACLIAAWCAALAGCSKEQEPAPPPAEKPDATAKNEPAPMEGVGVGFVGLGESPIAYFEDHCARCHGPFGSFYGDAFAGIASDRAMHGVVQDMVEGPANSTLDDASLFALVAFHRSLRDGTPFGVVTVWNTHAMAGEMTPGTVVSVVADGRVIDAAMDEATWRVESDDVDLTRARVRIMRRGRVFEWSPGEQAWSDAPPPTHIEE